MTFLAIEKEIFSVEKNSDIGLLIMGPQGVSPERVIVLMNLKNVSFIIISA